MARLDADRSDLPILLVHRRHRPGLLIAKVPRRRRDSTGRLLAHPPPHGPLDLPWLDALAAPQIDRRLPRPDVRFKQLAHFRRARAHRPRLLPHVADRAPYSLARTARHRVPHSGRLLDGVRLAPRSRRLPD